MAKRWKRILRTASLVLAGVVLLVLGFASYVYFHKPALKGYIEKTLSKRPGLTVTIGHLDYHLFPLRVTAHSVKVVFINVLGRAEVVVDRAEAAGQFDRVIHSRKPYLDSLSVSGLKIDFAEDPKSPPSGPVDVKGLARMTSGYLRYVSQVAVKGASVHLGLPVEGMDLAAAGVDITGSAGEKDSLALTVGRFDFKNVKPAAVLSAGFSAGLSWTPTDPFLLTGTLDMAARSVSLPDRRWQGSGFDVKTGFSTDGGRLSLDPFALDMPGLLALSGTARAGLGKDPDITVTADVDVKDLALARKTFAAFLPPDLPDLAVDGRLQWQGEVRRAAAVGEGKISVNGTIRLPASRVTYTQKGMSIHQTLQAEIRIEGGLSDLRAAGTIEGSRGEAVTDALHATGISFRLPFELSGRLASLRSFTARAGELDLAAGGQRIKVDGASFAGSGRVDTVRRSALIDSLTVAVPGLGRFDVSGQISPAAKPEIALDLRARGIEIANVMKSFAELVPAAVSAWQPGGELELEATVRNGQRDPGRYQLKGTIGLAKGAFQDATGAIVSESLETRLAFEADVSSPSDPIPFSVSLDLAKGESLWKAAYFNWKNDPVRLELKGEFDPRAEAVRGAEAGLLFGPLGVLRARGSASLGSAPRVDVHMSAPDVDLASLYSFLAKMRSGQPVTMDVRGRADLEADVRFSGSFSVRGKMRVRDAAAERKDGSLGLSGLEADLPFSISNGVRPGDEKEDFSIASGHLQVQAVKTPAVSLARVRLDFLAARNLFLISPAGIDLWGAKLGLGRTVLAVSPAGLDVRGVSTLALSELNLAKLPLNSDSLKISGTASIPEGGLLVSPREVRFFGRMSASLFGGRMTLDSLRVTDPFSSGRRVMFEAEIEGLDLGKVTAVVPFGEVTGVVDVSLKGFALSYGQPESFAMTIQSVPAKGVSRKFSVKAVDNLSVISSGGQAAAPSRSFLTRFIHSFNYSRIGIACSLRNDIFTLRGTVIERGVQYLVRRATFFGIDVVNAKPVNTISFKDMLGRLERVGRSQESK